MRSPRALAAVLLTTGLVTGTLTDRKPAASPYREEGYWLLAADFHVHAFFGDMGLAPWDLLPEAQRVGLDVVAVTNHSGVFGGRLNRWWSERIGGPLVLVGQEITSSRYHLVGVGLERRVEPTSSAADAIRAVHAQGGVAIAAHPGREYWNAFDAPALALLDGSEAAQPVDPDEDRKTSDEQTFYLRAKVLNSDIAPIGSSDFHVIRPLGFSRTYVLAREWSEAGVLDAVRRGQTVAANRDGVLYGDPALVARVAGALQRRDVVRGDARGVGQGIGLALTCLGLLGVVLFDGRRAGARA